MVCALAHKRRCVRQFTDAELLINITKHVLVPEHRLLMPEEKKGLLDRHALRGAMWPSLALLAVS